MYSLFSENKDAGQLCGYFEIQQFSQLPHPQYSALEEIVPRSVNQQCQAQEVIKLFSCSTQLNSAKTKIYPAHKC